MRPDGVVCPAAWKALNGLLLGGGSVGEAGEEGEHGEAGGGRGPSWGGGQRGGWEMQPGLRGGGGGSPRH